MIVGRWRDVGVKSRASGASCDPAQVVYSFSVSDPLSLNENNIIALLTVAEIQESNMCKAVILVFGT